MMKEFGKAISTSIIILAAWGLGIGAPLFSQHRANALKSECFFRILMVDHDMNCEGIAPGPHGTAIDPENVIPKWKNDKSLRHCPCGPTYEIEFVVGSHPICPIHGNLIAETGMIHHVRGPAPLRLYPFPRWGFATSAGSVVFSILGYFWCRKGKVSWDHGPDKSGGEPGH